MGWGGNVIIGIECILYSILDVVYTPCLAVTGPFGVMYTRYICDFQQVG